MFSHIYSIVKRSSTQPTPTNGHSARRVLPQVLPRLKMAIRQSNCVPTHTNYPWQSPVDSRRASIPCSETERTIILMVVLIKFVLNDRVHSGTSEPAAEGGGKKSQIVRRIAIIFICILNCVEHIDEKRLRSTFFRAHCYCMCVRRRARFFR